VILLLLLFVCVVPFSLFSRCIVVLRHALRCFDLLLPLRLFVYSCRALYVLRLLPVVFLLLLLFAVLTLLMRLRWVLAFGCSVFVAVWFDCLSCVLRFGRCWFPSFRCVLFGSWFAFERSLLVVSVRCCSRSVGRLRWLLLLLLHFPFLFHVCSCTCLLFVVDFVTVVVALLLRYVAVDCCYVL
jgi:hypothetical protein